MRPDDLKAIREGMTQVQMADMLGITPEHLSRLENGKRPITRTMALAAANVSERRK